MKVFKNMQTNWCGLWWHPETNSYVSQSINISELRKFKGNVKIVVRKNKFYNNGENKRPNYCFTIRDTASQNFLELKAEDYDIKDMEDAEEDEDIHALMMDF